MRAVRLPSYGPSGFPDPRCLRRRAARTSPATSSSTQSSRWALATSVLIRPGQCPVGPSPKHHGRACTPLVVPSWLHSGLTSADRLCSATGAVCPPARAGRTRLHPRAAGFSSCEVQSLPPPEAASRGAWCRRQQLRRAEGYSMPVRRKRRPMLSSLVEEIWPV